MKYHLASQKTQTIYKKPNPNFSQQLCTFLSQSKHQKQQQIEQINQEMIEQFIHLFEICNINRFIDYTKQFINEIRNIILRLQIVQKKQFSLLDEKDEFMYLIVEGKVQKIKRQKPQVAKRVTRFNMTALNFGSNPFANLYNSRASHQAFNNLQLKQFQKTVIMNRSSRMSMLSGNLLSQLTLSPRKRHKTQQRSDIFFHTFSPEKVYRQSPFSPKLSKFKQKIEEQEQNSDSKSSNESQNQKQLQKVELLQPLQHQVYRCLSPVKYIKLLKWSYDQLVQYVYKYQNDRLIQFVSKCLNISQGQVKSHQIYNKTNYNYFQQRQSRHSGDHITLNPQSIYILRRGSVELKYVCPFAQKKSIKIIKSQNNLQKNQNLANYINQSECSYKRIILNQGAVIYPQFQKNQFFIQSLQTVVFIEINKKLVQYLRTQIKQNWWAKKFQPFYKRINDQRSIYMKDQQVVQRQEKCTFHLQNVFIDTKMRRLHSSKSQNTRFRLDNKENEQQNQKIIQGASNMNQNLLYKQNLQKKVFDSNQYKQFISLLPYEIMVKSKQKIGTRLNQKGKAKHISDKVFNYLKNNQKMNVNKYKNKVLELKMKNIASKQIKYKDLNIIYDDINNNTAKKQFHKSLKGNWFKQQQNQIPVDNLSDGLHPNLQKKNSETSEDKNQNVIERNGAKSSKTITQIIALNKRFEKGKKKFTINTLQSTQYDQRKVTFALNNFNTLDDSSDQEYLCSDDTGLIKKFVQNSHNYQKEISYLINSSQREDKSQPHKKKKLKTCKTEGNNLLFSHNLINDIMKRLNNGSGKPLLNKSSKISEKTSKVQSKCDSVRTGQTPFNEETGKQHESDNDSNMFSKNLYQPMAKDKIQRINIPIFTQTNENTKQKQHLKQRSTNYKDNKTNSFTNYSSQKSQSYKFLMASNQAYNSPISMHDRFTAKSAKNKVKNGQQGESHVQSSFYQKKCKRPMTAAAQNATRSQCKSLMFNQWIETQPGGIQLNQQRSSEWGLPSYNYERNIASGDKKIWKRLKSGKIVKKSVRYFKSNQNNYNPDQNNFNCYQQVREIENA